MNAEQKKRNVYVAGHRGMVGSAIVRQLESDDTVNIISRSRKELDLLDQSAVNDFFQSNDIDEVYLAAAKVGGIHANDTFPGEFIHQNLVIQSNIIHSAHEAGVQKLLFLGSSCIYPKFASQPIVEDALLTGTLEATNAPYAIAKIAGIKMCESYNRQYGRDYRSVMPTNLYGPGDNFHAENSHVIPGLIRRFQEAIVEKADSVEIWGTGNAMREFLYVDDMASACLFVMELPRDRLVHDPDSTHSHINVGTGLDCTIRELATAIKHVSGFQGDLTFDTSRPDGTPRKLLDVSKLNGWGWNSTTSLEDGLAQSWSWFLKNVAV